MDITIVVLISVTITSCIMGLVYSINGSRIEIKARLEAYTQDSSRAALPPELNRSLKERVLIPLIRYLNYLSGRIISSQKKAIYEKKLQAAGNPYGLNAENFIVLKYSIFFLCLFVGLLLHNTMVIIFLSIMGIFIPGLFLKSNERKRKDTVMKSLPDVLDLLSVSVEAGLGFDSALQKVIEKTHGPLTDEFDQTLQEINIGKPRREALRDMADRVAVDDVTLFLGSIIQADQLGVSIGNVLRLQSRQVRSNRRMRAEEIAQKAPIKILIPLVLFIFPTILIVLLGPAVIQLMDTL